MLLNKPSMFCIYCNTLIPSERRLLQLSSCLPCAEKHVKPYKGDMNYQHKTAPTLMLMSPKLHATYRQYVPYGKLTGRGSGTHKMSRPTGKARWRGMTKAQRKRAASDAAKARWAKSPNAKVELPATDKNL